MLLFGGIETTEAMIANAFHHLLGDARALARARADERVLGAVVEESLRLEPAAAVLDRYATCDTELGGSAIARGDLVTLSLAGANRDPENFPDPDGFDLDRPNLNLQVAFAHGPHVCLGMHLARLETRVALARALERLPGLRLDPDRPAAPRGLVFRKLPTLHAVWDTSDARAPEAVSAGAGADAVRRLAAGLEERLAQFPLDIGADGLCDLHERTRGG